MQAEIRDLAEWAELLGYRYARLRQILEFRRKRDHACRLEANARLARILAWADKRQVA